MNNVNVILGAKAPMGLAVPLVRRSDDGNPPNYTTATAVRFVVRARNTSEVEWTATLSGLTPTTGVGTYIFADDGSDCQIEGQFLVTPWVTFTGVGERPLQPFYLNVTRTPPPIP